jgi:chemotaxis signal transduction protein
MKIVPHNSQSPRRGKRSEAVILFYVAGQIFAIASSAVHEIRSTDSLSSAASEVEVSEVPKVGHLLRRGHKHYYVVDACAHFHMAAARPTLVLVLRNSRVAVLVEQIERMETITQLLALPPSFSGPERHWYRGLAILETEIVPVVDPLGFLSQEEIALLDAKLNARIAATGSVADHKEAQGAFTR